MRRKIASSHTDPRKVKPEVRFNELVSHFLMIKINKLLEDYL